MIDPPGNDQLVYFPVACHEKYEEYIMCLGILSSMLESYEEDHVCILGDFNATPGSPRFNEICNMLHENNVMFRDTDILPDNTCTMLIMVAKRVHGWIILQCPMFCPSLRLTATPFRMLHAQIIVLLQLHRILTNCQ